ncbi:PREDICTED: SNW domain-containing protein 1-like [Galeopterus variegatus]|uniref:SNW domain-containing protein 1 n=1 Tax=Galeopterus variegatus TaxID=482537 RepID=A0ABM0QMW3_GALVR|nr:PREDICTED: SNW domain-containing protein 1-like [Galeopterus variegatus]
MTLPSLLPAPTHRYDDQPEAAGKATSQRSQRTSPVSSRRGPPPYGCQEGWLPQLLEDFGAGGAFPEIRTAQYPLDMGQRKTKSNALAIQVDPEGRMKYKAIARQRQVKDKVICSTYAGLVPKEVTKAEDTDLQRPDEEAIKEITEKTRAALEKSVWQKVATSRPLGAADKLAPAQYIRYSPTQQGAAFNSGATRRVIRMAEMQTDPMEPPRFKTNKKIPRGPPSPPAPVMCSPSRQMTGREQREWKIPPCISNWKNAKGYTIPLDKRLAADARGLQTVHISEKFARLTQALSMADRKAREAVEMRAQVERKMAHKAKERREEKLREMAQKARERRAGTKTHVEKEEGEAHERQEIRHDRREERQRARNLPTAALEKRPKGQRRETRDVTEVIALSMANPRTSSEVQDDHRLFDRSQGVDSGFAGGQDEMYNVYDRAWRGGQGVAQIIYRPSQNLDKDVCADDLEARIKTNRFLPHQEVSASDRRQRGREGPVQFEEDPIGLDNFLEEAKQHGASKRPSESSRPREREHESKRRRKEETHISSKSNLWAAMALSTFLGGQAGASTSKLSAPMDHFEKQHNTHAADFFPTRRFLLQTEGEEAEKDQFSLRKTLLVWTTFWKKPNSTGPLRDPQRAAAPGNVSTKARGGGRKRRTSLPSQRTISQKPEDANPRGAEFVKAQDENPVRVPDSSASLYHGRKGH